MGKTHIKNLLLATLSLLFLLSYQSSMACKLREGNSIPTAKMLIKNWSNQSNTQYHFDLLSLVLEKTQDRYGPCVALVNEVTLPIPRIHIHAVENNLADVTASTTSKQRDARLLPIRIPLIKGLMGYRIMFIRPEDQGKFQQVNSLAELAQFSFGQGHSWPDIDVLKANGIKRVFTAKPSNLTKMLRNKRFDAYPRGAQQVELEINEGIAIEQSLLLAYASPSYFHVAKDNQLFARRLEDGLRLAIEDGSFEQLFQSHELVIKAIKHIKLNKRRTLYLCNPNLHKDTALYEDKYWIKPWPKDKDLSCKKQGRKELSDKAEK